MTVAVNTLAMRSSAHGIGRYVGAMVSQLLAFEPDRYLVYSSSSMADRWRAMGARRVVAAPSRRGLRLLWEQTVLPRDARRQGATVLWGPAHAIPIWKTTRQVVTVHDLTWYTVPAVHTRAKRVYFRAMLREATRRADRVVVSSEATARDLERILGVAGDRVRVVLLAPDPSFRPADSEQIARLRERYGLPTRFMLSVGVIEPRKNLRNLVAALGHWPADSQPLPLMIAGSLEYGWGQAALLAEIDQAASPVRLLGRVPEEDLAALMSAAELLVYVPFSEGFGLPVLEAMACGTPVVASTAAALTEVAGDAAVFVDPNDLTGIATALAQTAGDTRLRERLRSAGIARARLFSWASSARKLASIFDELDERGAG